MLSMELLFFSVEADKASMRFRSHYAFSPPPPTAEDSSKVIFPVVFARACRRSISFFRWRYFVMFILFKVRGRRSSTLCEIMMMESELSDLIAFFYHPVFLLQLSNAYLTPVAIQYVYCLSTTFYIHLIFSMAYPKNILVPD